jgi:hypothetical protein
VLVSNLLLAALLSTLSFDAGPRMIDLDDARPRASASKSPVVPSVQTCADLGDCRVSYWPTVAVSLLTDGLAFGLGMGAVFAGTNEQLGWAAVGVYFVGAPLAGALAGALNFEARCPGNETPFWPAFLAGSGFKILGYAGTARLASVTGAQGLTFLAGVALGDLATPVLQTIVLNATRHANEAPALTVAPMATRGGAGLALAMSF